MSGHPVHHHPPGQPSYPYPSPSGAGHPSAPSHSAHLYHPSHRQSISATQQQPHTNGHPSSPHPSLPPSNGPAHRHGSVQMPPPPPSSAQQTHHHPSQQQAHPSHHQASLAQQQPPPPPHHSSHQHQQASGQTASYVASHHPQHPPQPSQPPPSVHHPQSHAHHPTHSREHQQMREFHSHHPSHPHPSHTHPVPSQRDHRVDPGHRERDHPQRDPQPRSHPQIAPHPTQPEHLSRDQQQVPLREPHHPQPPQSAHALPPHHSHSHPHAATSASHSSHPPPHHHPSSSAPPSGHHSPHPIPLQTLPHPNPSSVIVSTASQPLALSGHGGQSSGPSNGSAGGPGAHLLSGPPGPQPLMPPALPANAPGGGTSGRQLAQPPPQSGGANGTSNDEDAMVAAILRDGEGNLQAKMGDWRPSTNPAIERMVKETELTWIAAGSACESFGKYDKAVECYEKALGHNPLSAGALTKAAGIYRHQENFRLAASYFSRLLKIHEGSGEIWGALGHCYLMVDELPKAYTSYQQALHHFQTPKSEPKLWYGIGILYDRYGSLEHAEEAFSSVIKMDPHFEKANEIYFRLGIIYKQQRKADLSLECFQWILDKPPPPLTEVDIWFQIGHVHEQQGNFDQAKEAYERVLAENATHAKVLQQLGGLYCREGSTFYNPQEAVIILTRSLEVDPQDSFSWYLLGRVHMTMQDFHGAYESYQQAVYRDGKNPAFWCSIGVLYYAISQYHDSLDAYSRAIRINPYLSEVWYNLGALYESCNDQMPDAIDAYQRAVQLDNNNAHIHRRLEEIKLHKDTGAPLSAPPSPRDMSHTSANWPFPNALNGSPEGGLGAPPQAQEEAPRPAATIQSPRSPVANSHATARPVSPSPTVGRNNVVRPGTSNSAAGMRPQSSGPFAHGPPPSSSNVHGAHHPSAHPAQPPQTAQHVPPPSATLNRRQSGGHGPLAPMEFESSPRLGTRGPPSAQHNLPHIRAVVDTHSRGPSPAPVPIESLRRAPTLSGAGPREVASPRTSPSIRSNHAPSERAHYSTGQPAGSGSMSHPGPPPVYSRYPPATQVLEDSSLSQHSQSQGPAGGLLSRDRDRERSVWESSRNRPHSPDFRSGAADRDARIPPAPTPATAYSHRGGDYGATVYPIPPQPQHQSPYDPRHASPGLRGGPAPRFSPDQTSAHSPSWPAADHRPGSSLPPPGSLPHDDRRPGSQAGCSAQHYPGTGLPNSHQVLPSQHGPRRYDPRYDEPTIPPHRQSLTVENVSPQRPRSAHRPHHEEAERQKALAAARQAQPSPTPSVAASEFSATGGNGGGIRKTARGKQSKEEDYPPATHTRRRKMPVGRSSMTTANTSTTMVPPPPVTLTGSSAPPPTAPSIPSPPTAPVAREAGPLSIRDKKEKKKMANTKVRGAMKAKVTDASKRPSPSPAPPTLPLDLTPSRALPPTPPPPAPLSMPDRKVDEEFGDYDEVADALLTFAGQQPRRMLTSSQQSPTERSPHPAPPLSTGSRSGPSGPSKTGGASRNGRRSGSGNGVSPGSEKSPGGGGSGSGRSPSNSSHSLAQRSNVESPNRAGSSPEATIAQSHVHHIHLHPHGGSGAHNSAVVSPMVETSSGAAPVHGPLSGGSQSSGAPASYPITFSKRMRGDGSSPTGGDGPPEPKRSRSSIGQIGSGQPSPRSQSNVDGLSPLSGGGVSTGKTNMMAITGGRKGIMNEEVQKVAEHRVNGGVQNTRRMKKKLGGVGGRRMPVEEEDGDEKSAAEEGEQDEGRNRNGLDGEGEDEEEEGEDEVEDEDPDDGDEERGDEVGETLAG